MADPGLGEIRDHLKAGFQISDTKADIGIDVLHLFFGDGP